MAKIDSVYDFSDKALVELKSWLEPWFHDVDVAGAAASQLPFAQVVMSMAVSRSLTGYWRLGEAAAPFADTSGYPSTPANLTRHTNGTAMSLHVTGALPAADDDGAITQNYAGSTSSTNTDADWLDFSTGGRFDFGAGSMSVAAWINPTASANTWLGGVAGTWTDGISGSYEGGWGLWMSWPTRQILFVRGDAGGNDSASGGTLAAAGWTFVAATYDGSNIRLYLNGGLAATVASTRTVPAVGGIRVGNVTPHTPGGGAGTSYRGRFYGSLDEISVWGAALTPSEVATLYESGVSGPPGVGTVWYHGSGVPGSTLGGDGDYYLDTALGDVWFKASGTWTMIWDEP